MYTLIKIHDQKFRMIQNKSHTIIEGPWSEVRSYCEYLGFHDLDLSLQVMESNNHNAADFGIMKCFICSFNNSNIPKLKLVS